MLDARSAIGNFGEVIFAELLLLFEAERTMIGGGDLKKIILKAIPELFLVPLFAQWRSEDIFSSLEAGSVHVFEREIEILRTRLSVDRQSAIASFADLLECVVATEMDDIYRRIGHLGECNRARRGFGLCGRWASERVILRRSLPFCQSLFNNHVDGTAILGVHADHAAAIRRGAHGAEDAGIIEHEDTRISHEKFEAGHTIANELRHLVEASIGQVGDNAMEGVIGDGLWCGLLHPGIEGGA